MSPKKISGKTVWIVSLAAAVLVAALIALFADQFLKKQQQQRIVLPSQTMEVPAEHDPETPPKDDFLNVTNENVLTALRSISRPSSYHQTYVVTVGSDETQAVRTVELWVNGDLLRAEISADGQQTRILVSNGVTAVLWYEGSENTLSIQLEETLSEEDLLNLPDFDAFLNLEQDQVVDSDYLVFEDSQVQCIYVCTQEENGDTTRHWVSLENGLLYQSDVLENSNQVYVIRQTQYELLAAEDETFADRFVLPDGSDPFTAASEMQQP